MKPSTLLASRVRSNWPTPRRTSPFSTASGVTAVVGLHYLAALEDARTLTVIAPDTDFFVGNGRNRFDILTMTGGMDLILSSGSSIGFGVMLPLRDDDDRFFDVEMQATFTHFY